MKWTHNLHAKFTSFYQQLHYELLVLGYETNDFNFELFIEYLKNPMARVTGYNRANNERIGNRNMDSFWLTVHSCQVNRVGDSVIVNAYIEEMFNQALLKDEKETKN